MAVALPGRDDGAVTIEDQHRPGCRLKIPLWMLSPAAAACTLADQATIRPRALLMLAELLGELLRDGEQTVAEEYSRATVGNDVNTEGCDEATRARLRERPGLSERRSVRPPRFRSNS